MVMAAMHHCWNATQVASSIWTIPLLVGQPLFGFVVAQRSPNVMNISCWSSLSEEEGGGKCIETQDQTSDIHGRQEDTKKSLNQKGTIREGES
jgi:hypothetical protein